MAEKIRWYVRNKHDILSAHDQFLARFDVTQVHNMKRAQKSEWLRHLDVAQEAYDKDKTQRSQKQLIITKYMERQSESSTEAIQLAAT